MHAKLIEIIFKTKFKITIYAIHILLTCVI